MYNGIGLTTARGSGTNGYVQKNLAYIREIPGAKRNQYKPITDIERLAIPQEKQANPEILEHERKRQIEVKVMEWASESGLFDKDLPDEELEALLDVKRQEVMKHRQTEPELDRGQMQRSTDSHRRAEQKQKETENFKNALRIANDYTIGSAFDQKLQLQKKEERLRQKVELELQKRD